VRYTHVAFIAENYENQIALDAEVYGFESEDAANEWLEKEIARRNEDSDEWGEFMGVAFVTNLQDPE
jgi:hypothetical protein